MHHYWLSIQTYRFILVGLIVLASATGAHADSVAKAERGITGTYSFEYAGPVLRAKVQRDTDAPLIVRLQHSPTSTQYEVRFIGNISGQYDLREWLEHADGSAIELASPIPIEIVSTLPNDPRSDLFDVDSFQPNFSGGYRWGLALAVLAWSAVPITVIARRLLARPKEIEVTPVSPPMSLADQLKPLIEAASRGELSTSDKARFELLLVHYWRETAILPELDMARSIQQLRSHPQAGPIIAAVEQWLHSGSATEQRPTVQQVLQLLGPLEQESTQQVSTATWSQTP